MASTNTVTNLVSAFFLRLLLAVVVWAVLIAAFMAYSMIRPSGLALAALGLLVLWWFYIPLLFAIVCLAYFAVQWMNRHRPPVPNAPNMR